VSLRAASRSCASFVAAMVVLLAIGCNAVPRLRILEDLDGVRQSASAREAKAFAPGAFAHAEKLKRDADQAFSSGDIAGSQVLGERALAAFTHASALARIARAERYRIDADAKHGTAKGELGALEAELARASTEAEALELKVRVTRDAQAIVPSGKADPQRERARLAAARALAMQARLLCGAAKLLANAGDGGEASKKPAALDPKLTKELEDASAAASRVTDKMGPTATGAPIDEATRARAGCLAALTLLRRAATPVTRAPGAGDALLSEISAMGTYAPSRDDRGIVVTLRGIFANDGITPAGKAKLAELGKVAAAHPNFPIEVVVHGDSPQKSDEKRAEAVVKALSAAAPNAVRADAIVAGGANPLVDPQGADRARNTRVEVVFVTPESF
jgi:outer membrane protein OmpA-like peptidoglycan-associated protein